ncbi:SMC family ATPase, partial [candidate division GN15 bacterium]|nr:SMC family ATPase [candidate division GN15 bacterium]
RLAGDIEALDKRIAEARKQAEALAELRTDRHYGEKLVNLLGDFRQFLVGRIRPTLAELAGDLMTQMTDGRYSMVELDEQYELRVLDAGEFYGVSRFSGGEKDLANLCLRLAISQALTDSAGLPGSFVILDEVFGSQDAERKDLILRALANLKGRFPQIILVTHIEDIKDRVEELIEIVPTGRGWSEVRVNGQTIPTA